jgi:F0F1-type ATP synthase alpha subunit
MSLDKFYSLKSFLIFSQIGVVESIGDGIVNIKGLRDVANGEMISFSTGDKKIPGLVLNLEFKK